MPALPSMNTDNSPPRIDRDGWTPGGLHPTRLSQPAHLSRVALRDSATANFDQKSQIDDI